MGLPAVDKHFGGDFAGQDVLAKARTGTGKTIAFLVRSCLFVQGIAFQSTILQFLCRMIFSKSPFFCLCLFSVTSHRGNFEVTRREVTQSYTCCDCVPYPRISSAGCGRGSNIVTVPSRSWSTSCVWWQFN